jgi:hypothetical protein
MEKNISIIYYSNFVKLLQKIISTENYFHIKYPIITEKYFY